MKKLAISAISFFIMLSVVQAQTKKDEKTQIKENKQELKSERVALKKLEGTKVSEIAQKNFKIDYGNIQNVQWKRNGTFDEAAFRKDGKLMTAFYDIQGKLVGSTQAATFSELPARAQQDIKTKYKDYTVGPIVFFDDNEANDTDMILYGVQFDDQDTWLLELTKASRKIVVQVDKQGSVSFFKEL